ncbi:MAG: RNA ligase family protein [Candidatus Bathyarchaeota archaeon]|uniref:RNA ligase family protein n=1 Tax=Candidatus Bathycorpusculum sp. TaxID=2994959 RepID=UPI00281951B4|nr:RNA ligase family protein [Candidatus Termiticorpusculum sp.]MCL2257552.1 RNA ligase family protein [Candidatus Termiticorpusculum sp.]MCL2292314.1 RNA ligase family protein [Candidatus Termiticorpusculum sp.]
MSVLSGIVQGKVIPRNFGNIKHLTGSRLKDSSDSLMEANFQPFFTEALQFSKRDRLYVTEKVDGANVGVYKSDGILYPVMRKGYDVRMSNWVFLRQFADFVADNIVRFDALLLDGERVCGEWMIKTHSLFYKLPHEPFVVFDIIQGMDRPVRLEFAKIIERCKCQDFTHAGLVCEGGAVSVAKALEMLGGGFHGCQTAPEGVVYRYERDGAFLMSAKFVSNLNVGGDYMNVANAYNEWTQWH